MIYFAIELKDHDFSKSRYIRSTYRRTSRIIKAQSKNKIEFAIDGLNNFKFNTRELKYVIAGVYYISEPYFGNK
jgi:hypothetical protein